MEALAEVEPEAAIVLTLARLDGDGIGAETDVYLSASSAAALLATLSDDQRFRVGDQDVVALRVSLNTNVPPIEPKEPWDEHQITGE